MVYYISSSSNITTHNCGDTWGVSALWVFAGFSVESIPASSVTNHRASFEITFQFRGPRLYNSLPRELRNLTGCGTEMFKEKLDQYLAGIADEPAFPGFIPTGITETGAPSNSLIYQAAGRKEERRNQTRRRAPGS